MTRMVWSMIAVALFCTSAFALQVDVHSRAQVDGTQISIGDVATLRPALQRLLVKRINRAPLPGKTVTVKAQQIRQILLQSGVAAADLKFSGADAVQVKRGSQSISAERIQHDIDAYLLSAQKKFADIKFRFTPQGSAGKKIILPSGKLSVEVIPASPQVVGSRRFTLIYRVNGRTVRNLSVAGKLQALAHVVVARHNVRRGTIVASADVRLGEVDISKQERPLFSLADVVGMKALRNIRGGQIVEAKNLDAPPLVKKGAFVKIIARRGAMLLTATGIASQEGKMADVIRVRNTASQREIMARVIGPDQVEVGF